MTSTALFEADKVDGNAAAIYLGYVLLVVVLWGVVIWRAANVYYEVLLGGVLFGAGKCRNLCVFSFPTAAVILHKSHFPQPVKVLGCVCVGNTQVSNSQTAPNSSSSNSCKHTTTMSGRRDRDGRVSVLVRNLPHNVRYAMIGAVQQEPRGFANVSANL